MLLRHLGLPTELQFCLSCSFHLTLFLSSSLSLPGQPLLYKLKLAKQISFALVILKVLHICKSRICLLYALSRASTLAGDLVGRLLWHVVCWYDCFNFLKQKTVLTGTRHKEGLSHRPCLQFQGSVPLPRTSPLRYLFYGWLGGSKHRGVADEQGRKRKGLHLETRGYPLCPEQLVSHNVIESRLFKR